jgi:hypothetical protein
MWDRDKNFEAIRILSAVFSQNQKVAAIRLSILKFINFSNKGRSTFTEILRNIQSTTDKFYNSQRLSYDLRVLKKHSLVDQTASGNYTITAYGYYILDVYRKIAGGMADTHSKEKPGFVGGASGFISAENFDLQRFGEALSQLQFFKRIPSDDETKMYIAWRDDDDFSSEVEINRDGRFTVQVILYVDLPKVQGAFKEDLESTSKWHEFARSLAQAIIYYIQKTASKLWAKAEVITTLGPDSYPINLYAGGKFARGDSNKHS